VVLAVRNLRGESPARSYSNLREMVLDEEEDEGDQDESMLMEYETPGKSRDRDREGGQEVRRQLGLVYLQCRE
jgi:hypothetical protein